MFQASEDPVGETQRAEGHRTCSIQVGWERSSPYLLRHRGHMDHAYDYSCEFSLDI